MIKTYNRLHPEPRGLEIFCHMTDGFSYFLYMYKVYRTQLYSYCLKINATRFCLQNDYILYIFFTHLFTKLRACY